MAVGDGVVASAGWNGGFGNAIRLRHANGFQTLYGHLSRIRVRAGQRVSQGDVIGAVGMTGLATGPHLDYRMVKSGAFVNPLRTQSPPADPVPAAERQAFERERDREMAALGVVATRAPSAPQPHASTPPSRSLPPMTLGRLFLKGLLIFVPVSLGLAWRHSPPAWIFLTACLAILPLAGLMGEATEHLAHHTGPALGGLLNATFGNAAELIIGLVRPPGGRARGREGVAHRFHSREPAGRPGARHVPRRLETAGAALQPARGREREQRHGAARSWACVVPAPSTPSSPYQDRRVESISVDISRSC